MDAITLRAMAKVNLNLRILDTLPDGYHTVRTVMQSVSLSDRITLRRQAQGISLSCNRPYIPTDERNLAYKAVRALENCTGRELPVEIHMDKRIPTQAGLGGGSADCAAVLTGLNTLYGLGLKKARLLEVGASLGADVPMCLLGGTRLGEHLGEQLSPLPALPPCALLIVKPPFGVNTARAYAAYETAEIDPTPAPEETVQALKSGSLAGVCASLGNTFEQLTDKRPFIEQLKTLLMDNGALGALMTGSGSAVYGVFATTAAAQQARKAVPKNCARFLCHPVRMGIKMLRPGE